METIETDQTTANTVAENLSIKGDQIALRDLYVNQVASQGIFISVDSLVYQKDFYAVPIFTPQLIEKLKKNRLIIVTQINSFDTASLLRYIGVQIKQGQELEVLEIDSSKERPTLLKEFSKQGVNKVFVLDHLHPQAIDYDLSRMLQLAAQNNYYFLISTEVSEIVWQIKRNAFYDCWFSIPSTGIYSEDELQKDLFRKIEVEKSKIDFLRDEEITKELPISKGKNVSDISKVFHNPEQINLFVYQLIGIEEMLEEKKLQKLIEQSTDESAPPVVKWFHSLTQAQKLIVIGACLLEGVYDDQFFQLINEIVVKNWKYRDKNLLALDYCDLEFLHLYFEFDDHGDGKRILKGKYSEQRSSIIEAAWESYRRHILHALPILIDAARNTILSTEVNWEKFGTQNRRMAIRQAVGGTVSDIGIHSLETVEHALLEFAAVSEVTLQRITAKAMARWREYGHHDLLFDTLERWTQSEEIKQTVTEFLKNEKIASINKSSAGKALTYIKSTSVLALGYAADYDPPDELDQRLIDLLRSLISDGEKQPRERLKLVLPRLIQQHIHRLLPLITDELVREDDLQELISESLSVIYLDFPETIQKVLQDWILQCTDNGSEDNRRQKLTFRDKVLVTALKTYQKLDLKSEKGVISIESLYETLIILTKSEQRPNVQQVVWETIVHILQLDYEEANKQLHQLCSDPFSVKADILVGAYEHIYFKERLAQAELTDHKLSLTDEEEELPVWLNQLERPLTEVEKGVHQLLGSDFLSNRQLATKILLGFARKVDKEESENLYLVQPIKREVRSEIKLEPISSAPVQSHFIEVNKPQISLWIRFWIFILCFRDANSDKSRKELEGLYLVLRSKGLKSTYTQFLLNRWQQKLFKSVQSLGRRLKFLIRRAS